MKGLEMRADVRNRLLRQKKAVANSEQGEELEEVAEEPFLVPETEDQFSRARRQPSPGRSRSSQRL